MGSRFAAQPEVILVKFSVCVPHFEMTWLLIAALANLSHEFSLEIKDAIVVFPNIYF